MTYQSGSSQPPDQGSGSVLCDKCRSPVIESDQDVSNLSFAERLSRMGKQWRLSPRMWPVGYIIESPYSPLRIEQEIPGREWRDAFEDLLALETNGEMISTESRKEEKAASSRIGWERASHLIDKCNKLNENESVVLKLLRISRQAFEKQREHAALSFVDRKFEEFEANTQRRILFAQSIKAQEEAHRDLSASRQKDRGQWIASLTTSGAVRGWIAGFLDSAAGVNHFLQIGDHNDQPEEYDNIHFTEDESQKVFEEDKPISFGDPGPPMYELSSQLSGKVNESQDEYNADGTVKPPEDEPVRMSNMPERPYFAAQQTTTEHITLPNGKMANKVTVLNFLTNGELEEKVIVENPVKVLEEVERGRGFIVDRILGFDKPIVPYRKDEVDEFLEENSKGEQDFD